MLMLVRDSGLLIDQMDRPLGTFLLIGKDLRSLDRRVGRCGRVARQCRTTCCLGNGTYYQLDHHGMRGHTQYRMDSGMVRGLVGWATLHLLGLALGTLYDHQSRP